MKRSKFLLSITITIFCSLFINMTALATTDEKDRGGFRLYPTYQNTINFGKLIMEVKPGENAEDYLSLENMENKPTDFILYASEKTIGANGEPFYETTKNRTGILYKWISLEQEQFLLKPGEEIKVKITVSVPEDAEFGTYEFGAFMETSRSSTNNSALTISTRYMVPIEVKVTNNPQPIPKIKDLNKPIPTPYFYASIVIFLGCIGYFLYARRKEKRGRKKS
jgi:hypothetical protein